jgi:hypothetical protein
VLLFSDVGAGLYARSGFVARPSRDRRFASEPGDPADGVDEVVPDTSASRLPLPLAGEGRGEGSSFEIVPTLEQLDWHWERERYYAEARARPRPRVHAARVGRATAHWSADLKNDRLYVLRLEANDARSADALVRSACRAAHAAGIGEVVVWERPWPFAWTHGEVVEREDSIPMLCPLAAGAADWVRVERALWI